MLLMIFQTTWDNFIKLVSVPPHSLWFILLISFMVAMISTLLNRWLTDIDQANRQQDLIKEHGDKKKELMKMAEENPKKYAKEYIRWQRRNKSVQKMQQSLSMRRMKPMCITIIPFIIFFTIVRGIYTVGINQNPVGKPPMNAFDIPLIGQMLSAAFMSSVRNIPASEGFISYMGYYVLCSMALNGIIQKAFGITPPSGKGGMGQMFDQQGELPKPTIL